MNNNIIAFPTFSQVEVISSLTQDLLHSEEIIENYRLKIIVYTNVVEEYLIQMGEALERLSQELKSLK